MREDIDRFLAAIESERGFSHNTVVAYRNDLHQFAAYLEEGCDSGQEPTNGGPSSAGRIGTWQELTDCRLNDYLRALHDRPYAASTVARKTAAIKSFFQFLYRAGLMGEDPTVRMVPPRVDKYTPRAITAGEVDRLLEQPGRVLGERSPRPEALRDGAMLETLYATGMRVSELVSLDLADVGSGWVRCAGRSSRERRVPLRERAVRAIGRYLDDARPLLAGREVEALFLNHRGRRLTRQGFWLILKSYAERAEIADVTPQTLRHTFATHAIREGTDLRDVQHLLGHVSISTTQVYRRLANGPAGVETSGSPDVVPERDAD